MKYLTLFLFLLMALPEAGKAQGVIGQPIFKITTMGISQTRADIRAGCPRVRWNATCQEFLGALQAVPKSGAPKTVAELAKYFEDVTESACPEGMGTLALVVNKPARAIQFSARRHMGSGERCFFHKGVLIMSAECGNPVIDFVPDPIKVDTLRQVVYGDSAIIGGVAYRDSTQITSANKLTIVSFVRSKPVVLPAIHDTLHVPGPRDTLRVPVPGPTKYKTNPWVVAAGALVCVATDIVAYRQGQNSVTFKEPEGPVDPYNNVLPWGFRGLPSAMRQPRIGLGARLPFP